MNEQIQRINNKIFHAQCDGKQPCLSDDEWTEIRLALCEIPALRRLVDRYDQAYAFGSDPTIVVV